jgi:hypothetical protein
MKVTDIKTVAVAWLGLIVIAMSGAALQSAEKLSTLVSATGWDSIIGTWVDPETKGKNNQTTFAWKYEGAVIESITKMPHKETTSLFGRNQKTGAVFVMSADSAGGTSSGEVVFTKGLATFKISYVSETAEAGSLEIRYTLIDKDTMEVTFVMGQPVTMKLVRA